MPCGIGTHRDGTDAIHDDAAHDDNHHVDDLNHGNATANHDAKHRPDHHDDYALHECPLYPPELLRSRLAAARERGRVVALKRKANG